jgi:hypothetical protein
LMTDTENNRQLTLQFFFFNLHFLISI